MTNKKLKMAAMSVALTACVAASPLAAKADAPEAAPVELEKEPVAEETKKEENTAEPQVNLEAKNAKETLKGAEVEYDKENPQPTPDGSQKLDGVIVTNPEGSGETNPNPGSGETGSGETGGTTDPEQKKPEQIGTAEKTEKSETNVETKPDPGAEPIKDNTPPTVEKKPDGSSVITESTVTPGKEITTTTGSGEAKGDLYEKKEEVKKEDINLKDELGEKPDISWNIEKGADAVNGYKVEEVTNSDDGNKQTLKLRKEEKTTAEMTAEDIAKLVDAEKPTVNPDGTYTLTRTETILDAEGNPQTRTTYITIQDNKVTTKTTTELTITRQKEKQYGGAEVENKVVKYPEITVTNQEKPEEKQTISRELLDTILSQNPKEDGSYEYTDGEGQKYEIRVDETAKNLNNAEIVARLKQDGHTEYTLGADGEIYYKTEHGETVKLDVTQNQLLRRSLTYKVTLTTTEKGSVENESKKPEEESKARMNAIRDALNNAVGEMGVEDPVKAKLTSAIANATLDPNGGTFKEEIDGKIYTLTYTGAEVTVVTTEAKDKNVSGKDPEDITDVMDNTVTGTAYVTSGTISWTAENQKGEYTLTTGDASEFTPPEGATPKYEDGKLTGYTVTSEDADGNTVTTTYTPTYSDASGMTDEQRKELAMQALMGKTGKSKTELEAAGYTNIRLENASIVTWTVTQTTQKKTDKTEQLGETIRYDGDKNWTIVGDTLTYDGKDYTRDEKGNFTLTVTEDGKTVTYTATEQKEDVLSPEDAKEMLAKRFEVEISAIELNGTTATFTKDGAPVTVNCANLKKRTLTIERSEAASVQKTVVATDAATLEAAYEELWAEIVAKKNELGKDKALFVGDIEIKDTGEIKKQVIEYIKQHVTQADMSPEQLKAALKAQAEAAQKQMVTVNADSEKYKEELPNYYAGDRGTTVYVKEDGTKVDESKKIKYDLLNDRYYYKEGKKRVTVYQKEEGATYIKHLDLASGAELETKDGKRTDCVLVNPTLEWNYNADNLVDRQGNINVGLDSTISFDNEGGKGNGHYEYDRGYNIHPDKSAFYKVTGKVLYDAVKENEEVKLFKSRHKAFEAYLEETGQTKKYQSLDWWQQQEFRANVNQNYIVEIGPSRSNPDSKSGYQVYTKSANMTAYGYMTRDANTCINRTYNRPEDSWEYVGGYDLMISKLVQTKEGKVVGETESKVKTIFAPLSIRKSTDYTHRSMKLTKMTTVTTENVENKLPGGSQETVKYLYDQEMTETPITEETKVEGTGNGSYKSFTNLIRNIFKGEGTGTVEGGFIKYEYRTEKDEEGDPVKFEAEQMVVTTKQDAEVHYTFTSQESRDVWIKGYTQTVVPPVNPGPDTPELPPVEDAKPAPAPAPETPVLPAVQDAKLIQTGTSGWLADLMLGAGAVLSAAGYWMERKRKAMFYKSQH